MKMKLKKIFFCILSLLATTYTFAQSYPFISPTAIYTKPDGTTEEGESVSSPAPVIGNFAANPSYEEGYDCYYEWRVTKEGQTEPWLIRYEEDTEVTFTISGTHHIVCYAKFTKGSEVYEYTEEYWSTEQRPFSCTVSESKLEMPNAFSPNGDLRNDVYRAKKDKYQSIVEFHATIYNRWGQKLYEWSDITGGWDGTYRGSPCKEGVYFVVVKARGADGIEYNIKRDVNLMRGFTEHASNSSSE